MELESTHVDSLIEHKGNTDYEHVAEMLKAIQRPSLETCCARDSRKVAYAAKPKPKDQIAIAPREMRITLLQALRLT